MMTLPFVLAALGLGALFVRQRGLALGAWVLALAALLWLFHLHVTDPLPLAF
ncbi:DUF5993 family protein [uncultured Lamprocystis sp.]|jgi:hypothetical protein|uniref:DUF5993 family protein n=1 Tax=uncultured Lamprocystis sp. TaxID=543132 RepID=UPI0025E8EF5B|nr:DUF5993 family protein [uncultured Lamprocystis sp.]